MMKYKIIILILLIFSCNNTTTIKGQINFLNGALSDPIELQLMLLSENSSSEIYKTITENDGSYAFKVNENGYYYILITSSTEFENFTSTYLINKQYELNPGESIYLNDLYASNDFDLKFSDSETEQLSLENFSFSWENIDDADFYQINIVNDQDELDIMYFTKDTNFNLNTNVDIIPFTEDRSLETLIPEIMEKSPFYRKNDLNNAGEYSIQVMAIKIIDDKYDAMIAKSLRYYVTIHEITSPE